MWAFQYQHGDRPLDGYTVLRAAGRGGFGEVYQAVSDGGREVALKAVLGYEQVELRGIAQCMNLKNPNLVTIFDVKHNAAGRPFVIMEYIAGPSLRQLLDESPAGLGPQKAAFFLREIAKGLAYLHDCGVVHRDLKPGNIFFENGTVKIGDYGLSKAMTTGQNSAQTVTVGTVHYMAPEIGDGRYDRGIDIYALGAVLYELLTGTVPHVGASPAEVLLKHLSAEPDVSGVPEPFATVVRRAMSKDPAKRYAGAQEMVEAVFGAEHVRQSMSVFAPEELSVVAERAARRVPVGLAPGGTGGGGMGTAGLLGGAGPGVSSSVTDAGGGPARRDFWHRLADAVDRVVYQAPTSARTPSAGSPTWPGAGRQGRTEPAREAPAAAGPIPTADPMPRRHRWMLAALVPGVLSLAAGVLSHGDGWETPFGPILFTLLAIWSGSAALVFVTRRALPRVPARVPGLVRRLGCSAAVWLALFVASGLTMGLANTRRAESAVMGTWFALFVALVLLDVRRWAVVDRAARVELPRVVRAAFAGLILASLAFGLPPLAMAVLAGICMTTQVLMPWGGPAAAAAAREWPRAAGARPVPVTPPPPQAPPPPPHPVAAAAMPDPARGVPAGAAAAGVAQHARTHEAPAEVPWWRAASLAATAFTTAGLLVLLVGLGVGLVALLVPSLAASGLIGRPVAEELRRQELDFPGWSAVQVRLGTTIAIVLGLAGSALLLLGRRRHGWAHVLRTAAGAAGLLSTLAPLYAAVRRTAGAAQWDNVVAARGTVQALLEPGTVMSAAALFFAGVVLLAWPARRPAGTLRPAKAA